jgi:hypothetical protein
MNRIKQFLLSVALLLVGTVASAQSCVTTNDVTTCHYTIPDDGHAIVPIPFGFPFYGHVFTHSIFFDNGAVSFYSPTMPQRWGPSWPGGATINENISSSFFYSIIPLGADLIANGGTHFTQGNENFLTYNWDNVSQFGRWDSRNTFSVEIRPTGFIGINYDRIDISGAWVSGIIGNAALGEYETFNSTTSWSINETVPTNCSDPLVNVNCPGYSQAYFDQQCSINALYSPGCPGYSDAIFTQQCNNNTLYDPACPGYATAFYDYQCGLNALYHTGCPGYDDAYFTQQCGLDALYDEACSGYATAFYNQQCGLDPLYDKGCPGYDDALYVKNCTDDPLFDSGCTGYTEAYVLKYVVNTSVEDTAQEVVEIAVELEVESVTQTEDTTSPTSLESLTAAPATPDAPAPANSTATAAPARAAPTTRQALAEQRLAAAREQAAQAARENPDETTEAMDSADSMEQQVELQNVVMGAMSFVPGFDAYGRVTLPDSPGYAPFEIYSGQRNVDSPAARGLLGRSDRLHQEMIDAQYR